MTDAAFSVHPTPLGDVLIVVTDAGVAALEVLDRPADIAVADVAAALRGVPSHDPAATAAVSSELDAFFAGELRTFSSPIDWRLAPEGFARAALRAVCAVPFGELATYGEIAVAAGSPRAHRAVGSACARTPISIVVPAHRVVRSDGSIGEYGGHPERKRFLIDLESAVSTGTVPLPRRV
ncbi:methylated-DNA--[protein]-cysteine S-methyltransferase [Microbacterium oleivorans]|uniref:methylated-DNA--[protein]-cysteine S-methyltransferase n=1 Tax=Microbacterium oleivorans TaxID=273677 RepID=A0A7D5EUG6_9MICO|nr:methylated-DNA--[protein]-cysteine S-methyltransferase [Microbacterium oleivorans]QLD10751.1 methylated-DNA--[protein]-cysteine S-methyltransferase [Microbacterium oleivorans]